MKFAVLLSGAEAFFSVSYRLDNNLIRLILILTPEVPKSTLIPRSTFNQKKQITPYHKHV